MPSAISTSLRSYNIKLGRNLRALTILMTSLNYLLVSLLVFILYDEVHAADNLYREDAKAELHQILEEITSITSDFTQYEYDTNARPLRILEGSFKMAQNTKLRWEVLPPYSQTIISDGDNILVYDEDLQQLVIQDLDTANLPPFFLLGNNPGLLDEMEVAKEEDNVFILSDGTSDGTSVRIGKIWLFFIEEERGDEITLLPSEVSWTNDLEQTIVIRFSDLKTNLAIDNSNFVFVPPQGTDIIEQ